MRVRFCNNGMKVHLRLGLYRFEHYLKYAALPCFSTTVAFKRLLYPISSLSAQSRLSRIQSVLTPQLFSTGSLESSALSPSIEAAAAACGARTPVAAAAAWAIGAALPLIQQPPPLLPRAIQLLCVILANFSAWLNCVACALLNDAM